MLAERDREQNKEKEREKETWKPGELNRTPWIKRTQKLEYKIREIIKHGRKIGNRIGYTHEEGNQETEGEQRE